MERAVADHQAEPPVRYMRCTLGCPELTRRTMTTERRFYSNLIGKPVRVYLLLGIRLEGTLLEASDNVLVLDDPYQQTSQLVYIHSITTVCEPTRRDRVKATRERGPRKEPLVDTTSCNRRLLIP
jgi:sRNA-binding regulator protein Hfq